MSYSWNRPPPPEPPFKSALTWLFQSEDYTETLRTLFKFTIFQSVYIIMTLVILSIDRPSYLLFILVAFLILLASWCIIMPFIWVSQDYRGDEVRRFRTKMLPFGVFLGFLWSFIPNILALLLAVKAQFAGIPTPGYIFFLICQTPMTTIWLIAYKTAEEERYSIYPVHTDVRVESTRESVSLGISTKFRAIQ